MDNYHMRLTVLGTRGSIPVSGKKYKRFGGSTSCYMVEAGGETIFLDAGSGLFSVPKDKEYEKPPVILLSHLHLDHVLGLGMFPPLYEAGMETRLYLRAAPSEKAEEHIAKLYKPPYWPVPLVGDTLKIEPLKDSFYVGDVLVECMEGKHPGDCEIFRLSYGDKRLVYATDYEPDYRPDHRQDCTPDDEAFSKLIHFCSGADLLLYDAQYTPEDYEKKRNYGHSTAEKGIELLERSGAKMLRLIHHDPGANDVKLLRRERKIGRENVRYAREREKICL